MLSIVICTLNEEQYLPKLLRSIFNQDFTGYEVIVVDAGSQDHTLLVAQKEADAWHKDITLTIGPKGVANQRNYGLNLAKNERVLFLDADGLMPDQFLAKAMAELVDKNIEVAGTIVYAAEPKASYRAMFWGYSHLFLPLLRLKTPAIHGCSIFTTKTIHSQVGGFTPNIIFEDYKYGEDAAKYFRPVILKSVFMRTSARRFYNANFASIFELFINSIRAFKTSGVPMEELNLYTSQTGQHQVPEY